MKGRIVIAGAAVATLALAGTSFGAWVTGGTGAGSARAKVMPAGNVPSATVSTRHPYARKRAGVSSANHSSTRPSMEIPLSS